MAITGSTSLTTRKTQNKMTATIKRTKYKETEKLLKIQSLSKGAITETVKQKTN